MGIPMEYIGTSRIGSNLLRHIPIVGTSFTSTVPVEAVARTAVQALQGRYMNTAYQNIVPAEIIRWRTKEGHLIFNQAPEKYVEIHFIEICALCVQSSRRFMNLGKPRFPSGYTTQL